MRLMIELKGVTAPVAEKPFVEGSSRHQEPECTAGDCDSVHGKEVRSCSLVRTCLSHVLAHGLVVAHLIHPFASLQKHQGFPTQRVPDSRHLVWLWCNNLRHEAVFLLVFVRLCLCVVGGAGAAGSSLRRVNLALLLFLMAARWRWMQSQGTVKHLHSAASAGCIMGRALPVFL